MIALIIIGVIIFLLVLILCLPASVDLAYDDEFVLKVKYSGITLFDNSKKPKEKKAKKVNKKSPNQQNNKPKKKKDNFIIATYKQKGLLDTISYFSNILVLIFKKLWWLVKRLKFRRFKIDLTVATNDAANTAIQYGKTCAAVYPVLACLQANSDFKSKEVNINADFDKKQSEFKASILITTRLFYLIVVVISALLQFYKLQNKESEKHERKQP